MAARQYRLVLFDARGTLLQGAQYMHVSDEPPTPGLRIDLPQGTWFVHEVTATYGGDGSSRLLRADDYGGTLVCRPNPVG
jgi:hypothetical protein